MTGRVPTLHGRRSNGTGGAAARGCGIAALPFSTGMAISRAHRRFNVRSIPTLLVPEGGREIDRIVGAQPKSEIARRLEGVVA